MNSINVITNFLTSVKNKDQSGFSKFLNEKFFEQVVLPGGDVYSSLSDFISSQKDWFNSVDSVFDFKILNFESFGSLLLSEVLVDIDWKPDVSDKVLFLTILFCREKEEFFLRSIQNTVVKFQN